MSVYSDKVVKELKRDEIKSINAWRKDFCRAFNPSDLDTLKKLSDAADGLWARHLEALAKLRTATTDPLPVWPDPPSDQKPTTTQWKDEQYRKILLHPFSPYRRLKLAMDYWCALWFWPIDQADKLPSRDEFLMEMSVLLGTTPTAPEPAEEQGTLPGFLVEYGGVAQKVQPDLDPNDPAGLVNVEILCKNEKLPRLGLVAEIAKQRRFLHWELEFTDLFARRGGFDLIAGNPPWVKVTWEEAGILSERNPAFALRKLNASEIAQKREEQLSRLGVLSEYLHEYEEFEGTQNFLNAIQNYPLLKGQQTNLFKCFITRAWELGGTQGVAGFLHPEGVYDDPNGGPLRRSLYPRLRQHLQFQNGMFLFPDIAHRAKFSINIYGQPKSVIAFQTIANLFSVSTVESCYSHEGHGLVPGIKSTGDEEDEGDIGTKWTIVGHRDRIVDVDEVSLRLFARIYDGDNLPPTEARLPVIHSRQLIAVLTKFASYPRRVADLGDNYYSTVMWDETNAVKQDHIIRRETRFPLQPGETVLSGPHFYVANPCYKTPRKICTEKAHYDSLDLQYIPDDYLPRTNYVPSLEFLEYQRHIPVVPWGKNMPITSNFRAVVRKMLPPPNERTLASSIAMREVSHISGCLSIAFRTTRDLIAFSAMSATIVCDFFTKVTGKPNFVDELARLIPLYEGNHPDAFVRTLALNCLTMHYEVLWSECWDNSFCEQEWLGDDSRLNNSFWRELTPKWKRNCALRTDYTRRWALVELDVLAARALGLSLEELQAIYRIQFPVLRGYEADTWYDQKGRIIFTNSKGLPGVGLARAEWNGVKDLKSGTVSQTVTDNTLPTGPVERTLVYEAPFTRCDREQDYATVWAKLDSTGG